jgi:hydroxymethylpyrimidine/phosphomethylpyrimidine kinase
MTIARPPVALSVAGSDSGGGAGLQADLKTFHRLGVYGTTAVTLVTAQNTTGVSRVERLAPDLVAAQIDAVAADFPIAAAKTGALGSAAIVAAVAAAVARHRIAPLVVDPVLLSKHGEALLDGDAVETLVRALFPLAALVTPNRPETEAIVGGALGSEADLLDAARALLARGARAVLIKGGHAAGDEVADLLYDGATATWLRAPRVDTPHTHGTGCSYAAAIAARLAHGDALDAAVRTAHAWLAKAIATAPGIGRGQGPINHWATPPGVRSP